MFSKYPGIAEAVGPAPYLNNQTGIPPSLDSQWTWQLERLLGPRANKGFYKKEPQRRQGTFFRG